MILLTWSLFFLLGTAAALHFHLAYLIPFGALVWHTKKPLQGVILLLAGALFTLGKLPAIDSKTLDGTGVFRLKSLEPTSSFFGRSNLIKGEMVTFETNEKTYTHIPCTILSSKIPRTGSKWIIEGQLEDRGDHRFRFKPKKHLPWEELKGPSLARWRYEAKEKVSKLIENKTKDRKTAHFFTSMATGNTCDKLMEMEFRKVGLGHILAISGFHFALLAALLSFLIFPLMPPHLCNGVLLILLTIFFLYMGPTPSIFRAYLMVGLYLGGHLLKRRSNPLNLLGAALLIELIVAPLSLMNIGFQLSFLATFSILTLYKRCSSLIERLFPKRPYHIARKLPLVDKLAYRLTTFLRGALALNLSLLIGTLPTSLFIFGQFPLISLPYNLVLPPFLALSMLLLPFSFISPIHFLNEKFTKWTLTLIANPPEKLNFNFYAPPFPFTLLVVVVTLITLWGLTKRENPSTILEFRV